MVSESQTIKDFIEEDVTADVTIPLPNVSGKVLTKVIEFGTFHAGAAKKDVVSGAPAKTEAEIKAWDAEFISASNASQGLAELFELISAANYLGMKSMLDLTCQAVALRIKGKTPDKIRKIFSIKNDLTAAEEEEVRRENRWAFDSA